MQTMNMCRPYSEPCSEPYAYTTAVLLHDKIPSHIEDCGDPYWEPSSWEDELRRQLLKLKVQEIPREDLE